MTLPADWRRQVAAIARPVLNMGGLVEPGLWRVVLVPSLGIAALLGFMLLMVDQTDYTPLDSELFLASFAQTISVPPAILVWLTLTGRDIGVRQRFSPVMCFICLALMALAAGMMDREWRLERIASVWAIMLSGLFIWISPQEYRRHIRHAPGMAGIMLIMAFSAGVHYACDHYLWQYLCSTVAHLVHGMMTLFQVPVTVLPRHPVVILSENFGLEVHRPCSGFDGIFLFFFLLSVVLMIDWEYFKRRGWWWLYVFGGIYMFLFNGLRITLLFLLGHWAHDPMATDFQASFKGAPLQMFHSYIGWISYLVAFMIFSHFLYRHMAMQQAREDDQAL